MANVTIMADDPAPSVVWDANDGVPAESNAGAHPQPTQQAATSEKRARNREETASISSSTIGSSKIDELLYHHDVLNAIFHHIPIGVALIDAWGEVRGFSKGAERMFMYSSWEVVGDNVKLLMPSSAASRHDYYLSRARQRMTQRLSNMLKQPEAGIAVDSLQYADEEQEQRVSTDILRMMMFGGQRREVLGVDKTASTFPMEIAVSPVILKAALYYLGYLSDVRDLTLFQDLTVKQELLLRSVLDSRVIARLLGGERVIADLYDSVTIGFIEIDEYFEKAISLDTDKHRADFVREVFHVVDTVVAESPVYKVKSMGAQYIIASGVPIKREDHATLVVVCCVAVQQALAKFNKQAMHGKKSRKDKKQRAMENIGGDPIDEAWRANILPIKLRIGIHTGTVVGSFFSQLKAEYNVYGTATIRAGQLKETCRPGAVHISAETYHAMTQELTSLATIRRDGGIPYTYDLRCTEGAEEASPPISPQ